MISKKDLEKLYLKKKLSMAEVADFLEVSYHKVTYWMKKHKVKRRSWSEAAYVKSNPTGDPFEEEHFVVDNKSFLKGLGIGFYWGEGTKADSHSIRISNSDPDFLRMFINFLDKIYRIDMKKLRFSIHLFDDLDPKKAMNYWIDELSISKDQFYKTQIVKIRGKGTYNNKSRYGVLTVYFNNKKLRDIIMNEIQSLKCSRS